jgi:hypothetical protein
MLYALDIFFTVLHLTIIGFNLFGWIHPKTQKAHLITILLTAASWFLLGIWFGIGYCPITDWQWQVKEKLGETNLPDSFITYYANKLTGKSWDPELINIITVSCFALAVILTVYTNFLKGRKPRQEQ